MKKLQKTMEFNLIACLLVPLSSAMGMKVSFELAWKSGARKDF